MPSSSRPYQSRLLRFVLTQLQQGLERQRQVWRQVQSTAAWGAQMVFLPIYQLLQRASQAGVSFSGSDPAPQLEGDPALDDNSPTQQLLGHLRSLLLPEQRQRLLAAQPQSSLPEQPTGLWGRWLGTRTSGGAMVVSSSDSLPGAMTLASSLDSRHLVLVTEADQLLDILTADQRQQLSAYIVQIMAAYWQAQTAAVAGRIYQQLPATSLPVKRPVTPLPVLKRRRSIKLPRLPRQQRRSLAQAAGADASPALGAAADDEVEVSPSAVTYLEHPLERLLRWLDRLLSWLERLFQRWFG